MSTTSLNPARDLRDPVEPAPNVTYELFILLVTLLSLTVALARLFVPFDEQVELVLMRIDGIYSIVLLADYAARVVRARSNRLRYVAGMGVFDLLGSLPAVPLLRLLRIPRLVQQWRLLLAETPQGFLHTARQHLASSTLWTVSFVVLLVVLLGSAAIVGVEAGAPNANIVTGDDAIWWSIVTIATVGYGDRFPVTFGGRLIGTVLIVMGVSLFSVLTSFLASIFLKPDPAQAQSETAALQAELATLKQTLTRMDARLETLSGTLPHPNDGGSESAGARVHRDIPVVPSLPSAPGPERSLQNETHV